MKITTLIMGAFQTNTYVITDGNAAAVIDPAGNADMIMNALDGTPLDHILLTHGHFDHTSALADLQSRTEAAVYIHEKDEPMLNDIEKSFAVNMPERWKPSGDAPKTLLKDGDMINISENLQFRVIHTPGHSGGSVIFAAADALFTGDTLFAGSVGRIDGWSGSHREQMESLEKIKLIEGDFRVLPGHGDSSTLAAEKRSNPFLQDL